MVLQLFILTVAVVVEEFRDHLWLVVPVVVEEVQVLQPE